MRTTPDHLISKYTEAGWWDNITLDDLFAQALVSAPERVALIDPPNRQGFVSGAPQRLTFQQVDQLTQRVAIYLYESGLRQGDKVLVQMPNVVEIVLIYLAASRLGLIVSPVAIQYGQFELSHINSVISPKAYLAFENFQGKAFGAVQAKALSSDCQSLFFDDLFKLTAPEEPRVTAYKEYIDGLEHNANDIFTICWTSGTTGRSKGVPRSHNHWLSSTLASEDSIKLETGAVMLNPFPFINMAAIGGFLYYWLKVQATMVLHHPFDPMVFLSQLQNEEVEYTIAPPAVLNRLLQTKDQVKAGFDLSALKIIGSGSAPLSPHMIEGFKHEFGIDVVNIFGSNEGMAILSSASDVPDPAERALFFPRFGRSEFCWDNRISERLETKLVDPDTGAEITENGQIGECLIRGVTVFDGYYKSPEDNAAAFTEDGYFRSGDLFEIVGDRHQFYRFVGRCKSLIVRGGVNISPEELDEVLEAHPAVLEGAVAAYPDDILGEKICAVVVLQEGKNLTFEGLMAYMADKKLAKFKWPERLEIVEKLPRNAMNKVMRSEIEKFIA